MRLQSGTVPGTVPDLPGVGDTPPSPSPIYRGRGRSPVPDSHRGPAGGPRPQWRRGGRCAVDSRKESRPTLLVRPSHRRREIPTSGTDPGPGPGASHRGAPGPEDSPITAATGPNCQAPPIELQGPWSHFGPLAPVFGELPFLTERPIPTSRSLLSSGARGPICRRTDSK